MHEKITEESVAILTAYRTNCAATTSAGQLILPEAFKLLPVYMHACMRSQALRGGMCFSFSSKEPVIFIDELAYSGCGYQYRCQSQLDETFEQLGRS